MVGKGRGHDTVWPSLQHRSSPFRRFLLLLHSPLFSSNNNNNFQDLSDHFKCDECLNENPNCPPQKITKLITKTVQIKFESYVSKLFR